jgi:hypothetical protein
MLLPYLRRNNTKMRHLYDMPQDDGLSRSTRCPPAHPLMALPSHHVQASMWMAQPSRPLTRSPASMVKVSSIFNQWGRTKYSPPTTSTMGGNIVRRLHHQCHQPERVHSTVRQRGGWHPCPLVMGRQCHRVPLAMINKWGGDNRHQPQRWQGI